MYFLNYQHTMLKLLLLLFWVFLRSYNIDSFILLSSDLVKVRAISNGGEGPDSNEVIGETLEDGNNGMKIISSNGEVFFSKRG